VEELNRVATGGLKPNLTFVLDLDPRIGLARVGARGILDRMEKENLSFHKAVRRGYLNLVKREPRRCRRIAASQSRDAIHDQMLGELKPWLK
jgi:dTMP kinase